MRETEARRAFAADLRNIAEGIEAGDYDLCVVAFRLSHIEGEAVDRPQIITGRFAAQGRLHEEVRALVIALLERAQDEQKQDRAKQRNPEA